MISCISYFDYTIWVVRFLFVNFFLCSCLFNNTYLQVSDQQLKNVYRQKIKTMDALRISEILKLPVPLCDNDWLDHLGDKEQVFSFIIIFAELIS